MRKFQFLQLPNVFSTLDTETYSKETLKQMSSQPILKCCHKPVNMETDHRNRLEEKRAELQKRLRFEEFLDERVKPFLEVLGLFKLLDIKYTVLSSRCIPLEFQELFLEYLRSDGLSPNNLRQIPIAGEDAAVETILEIYPSVNPLRYVLDAEIIAFDSSPAEALKKIVKNNHLIDDKVSVCFLNYAFILEVHFKELVEKADDELFNTWLGDVLIFPRSSSWLIAYSLEEEWRFKR